VSILVTGAAGFIGAAVSARLLAAGERVIGLDNLNAYYDPALKQARLSLLAPHAGFSFVEADIAEPGALAALFATNEITAIVHLAAQAGVRYSLERPDLFIAANLTGFGHVLEAARQARVRHLVFASSSSVYGLNTTLPYAPSQPVDHPISLYAATKRANELMAHSYAHLFGLPVTGLRFFTVYGPWGRPDMAYFHFTARIMAGEPIEVFHHGKAARDFTYVDDVAEGVACVLARPPRAGEASAADGPHRSSAPYRIFNIGNSTPVSVTQFIDTLEEVIGRKAVRRLIPPQAGDVEVTAANVSDLIAETGFAPSTPLAEGLKRFVAWRRSYTNS
jgi:UDP-glucuronate 4-epimerase